MQKKVIAVSRNLKKNTIKENYIISWIKDRIKKIMKNSKLMESQLNHFFNFLEKAFKLFLISRYGRPARNKIKIPKFLSMF
jgi:hypothetical protein